jgi:3-deoxy-D-manno-octulosonic-acid transferase
MLFWSAVYNIIVIPALWLALQVMRLFNKKASEREKAWKPLLSSLDKLKNKSNSKRIWFHASSMGEFEQAKPVIEKIKAMNPDFLIIVSFYSPSGYNNQKNYKFADAVLYMPFDSPFRAKQFISRMEPDIAVFVRYEIWRNHLRVLKKKKIPAFLICATEPANKALKTFPIIKSLARSNYSLYDKIYTVSEAETHFFRQLKIKTKIITLTDTRFDRIVEKVESAKKNKILHDELFNSNQFVFVAGSTWEPDEEIIINTIKDFEKENIENIKFILVPHEPAVAHIDELKQKLPNTFLLSEILKFLNEKPSDDEIKSFLGWNHIIVDSIGQLLSLYSNADAAYIGGGFGVGVHSVTEPAGYGIPLSCGPVYKNSPDAVRLHAHGALSIIHNDDDMKNWLNKIMFSSDFANEKGNIAKDYIYKNTGSSLIVANEIMATIHTP